MKYKGINKIYFGIGLRDDYQTLNHKIFFFYLFKLKQKNPEGEMLKKGRDYIGFNLLISFKIPNFGINY